MAVEPEQLVLGAVLHHKFIAVPAELDNRVPRRVLDYNRALSAVELDPLLGPIPNDDIPFIASTAHIERGVVAVEPEHLVLGAVLHHDLIAISAELDNRVPRHVLDYNRALSAVELDPLLARPHPER